MTKTSADQMVLVTGASGYIGSHVVQQLMLAGYRVRGTVRSLKDEAKVTPLRKLVPHAEHPLELFETDLTKDAGWIEAVSGCWAVVHVASVMASLLEDLPSEVFMVPAVQGTQRVLEAAAKAGVRKLVLTGSFVSVNGEPVPWVEGKVYSEEDWTDFNYPNLDAYVRSKVLAEKMAWEFVEALPDNKKMDLTVLLPVLVWGPPLLKSQGYTHSVDVMNHILIRTFLGVPHLNVPVCDVRDVALSHVKALSSPEAAGKRIVIHGQSLSLPEVVTMLSEEFSPQGYTVSTYTLPYFVWWVYSFCNKKIGQGGILNKIGKDLLINNQRMVEILDIKPTEFKETAFDMAYAMIDLGITYRSKLYRKAGSRAKV